MDYDKDFEDGFENTSLGAIHYKHHAGSGAKLIFLHGFVGTTKAWIKLVEYLPDNLDITLLDLLGFGSSDKPEIDYTISTQFQALREFIALRNCGDSYICGHSYGGWIAAYYGTQPYTSKGIVIIDAVGLKDYFDGEITKFADFDHYKEDLIKQAMMYVSSTTEQVIRSTVQAGYNQEEQLTADNLAMIKVPTLIIWGSEDTVVEKKFGKLFADMIKDSKLEIIKGGGHNVHYTNPKEVSELIFEFVHEHS